MDIEEPDKPKGQIEIAGKTYDIPETMPLKTKEVLEENGMEFKIDVMPDGSGRATWTGGEISLSAVRDIARSIYDSEAVERAMNHNYNIYEELILPAYRYWSMGYHKFKLN